MHASLRPSHLSVLCILAACGTRDPAAEGNGTMGAGLALTEPSTTSDAVLTCGVGPTVFGIDVSYWQGNIDWDAVRGAGVEYAIARIGDGTYRDPMFEGHWQRMREVGIIRGSYQFFRPNRDPIEQANIVVEKVGMLGPGDLPVTIDVEAPENIPDPGTYINNIRAWIARVTEGTGKAPIIYTGKYYWASYVGTTEFNHLPLWHAQYTSAECPNIADAWGNWAVWQYSSTGSVPGIGGNVDMNRFNGTLDDVRSLAGALVDPECANPNYGGCNGTVVTRCTNGRVGSGDCGYFGATCSTLGGTPHCVHPYCNAHGGESATWCDGSVINTCNLGQLDTGDCGFFGAPCSMEGGTAHCVHPVCVNHGGENVTWCDGAVAMTCTGGRLEEGNCGFFGAPCSMEGGTAHCVHPVCVNHGGENVSWCDGAVAMTCSGGRLEEGNCGFFGAPCSTEGGAAHCVHPYCAAHGSENASWCDGSVINTCTGGRLDSGDCGVFGASCSTEAGSAHCVHYLCNVHGGENSSWCDGEKAWTCELGVPTETDCTAQGDPCRMVDGEARCGDEVPVGSSSSSSGQVPSSGSGDSGGSSTSSSSSASSSGGSGGNSSSRPPASSEESNSSTSSSGGGGASDDVPDAGVAEPGNEQWGTPGCSSARTLAEPWWLALAILGRMRRRHA